ncbi:MAG TPA: ATP-dependent Clp protease adaptor ClpS [Humisphaera sp.]|jgi:ATP-dependent Clp protease adaptor protein ClpS|nr:ATP-dependent Clp protease adaptor ClpS [Humisphaera sp.]
MATLLNFFGWKAQVKAAPRPTEEAETRQLPPYNVVLINDQQHTYDYVVQMVRAIFGYSQERGLLIAVEVDKAGRAIICTTHRELAELRREQVHTYGADQRIATCQGSMSAIIEPA